MISTEGRVYIKRYLAGLVPSIGRSIAFGIGTSAESTADTKLQFEVGRSEVTLTSYDFVNNKLIFKAPVDESFGGTIYEAALYSTSNSDLAGSFGSRILTAFESDREDWADPSTAVVANYTTGNARIGGDSLFHAPAASATETDALAQIFLDLSGYSAADRFVFAYNVGNAFTSNIKYRFLTDASNYYEFALGSQTSGYKITEQAKSAAVATGSPNWANITELRILTTSTAGGASAVDYDGIRIDDADTFDQEYVMVSREVLATPFVKQEGRVQEIEFALDVNIS
jgi:hypothetical protein